MLLFGSATLRLDNRQTLIGRSGDQRRIRLSIGQSQQLIVVGRLV